MKKKCFKILSLFLSFSTIFTSVQPSYAYDMENGNSVEMIEYQNSSDEGFSNSLNVFAELSSIYKVTIPKVVVLSGTEKNANYYALAEGDIAGYEYIHIVPEDNFKLHSKNKNSQDASVWQEFTCWSVDDLGTKADGRISAPTITAGKWTGIFYFNIWLDGTEPKVAGDIILPPNIPEEPLDDDYRLLIKEIGNIPGIYDDKGTIIKPWSEIEKEIKDGKNIKDIVNNTPNTSIVVLPENSNINKEDFNDTNTKYIYKPGQVDDSYELVLQKISDKPGLYNGNGVRIASIDDLVKKHNLDVTASDGPTSFSHIINTYYPGTTYVSIPKTMTTIPSGAFKDTNIKYVYIPSTVKNIEKGAFSGSNVQTVFGPKTTSPISEGFINTPAGNKKQIYSEGKPVKSQNDIKDFNKIDFNNLPEKLEDVDVSKADLILEKGSRYEITALYNFVNDVTKESTIKSNNERIVKFVPDCYLDALNVGTAIISGTYYGPNGKKEAFLVVHVVDKDENINTTPSDIPMPNTNVTDDDFYNLVIEKISKTPGVYNDNYELIISWDSVNKQLSEGKTLKEIFENVPDTRFISIPENSTLTPQDFKGINNEYIYKPGQVDDNYELILNKISNNPGIYNGNGVQIASIDDLIKNHGLSLTETSGPNSFYHIIKTYYPNAPYISIPKTLSTIPTGAFSGSNSRYVYIPSNVKTIEDDAFSGSNLQKVYMSNIKNPVMDGFRNTPAYNNGDVYMDGKRLQSEDKVQKINFDNLPEKIEDVNKEKADIVLEAGNRYQIKALYNFTNDVTKQSTITSSEPSVVKFVPDCYLDALKPGTSIISGTYYGPKGVKNAFLVVKVIGEDMVNHEHEKGNVYKEDEIKPTCEKDGSYTEVSVCKICGIVISKENKTVAATGHKFDEGKITTPASCNSNGIKTYTCTICNDTKTETISKLEHTPKAAVKENEIAATCEKDGSYDEVVYCSVCNAELSRNKKTIPALGHKAKSAVKENEVSVTCTSNGSYDDVVYCSVCNAEISRTKKTITALGHNYVEGTCTRCGNVLPALSVTASGFTGDYDSKAHSITVTSVGNTIQYSTDNKTWTTTNPTFTNAGTYTVYYKVSKPTYKTVTGNQKVIINKANGYINTKPTAKTLTYTGSAQQLINAGNDASGTIQYSLDNKTWSTSIPTGTDAKTYTVYYKVDASSNYNAVNSANINVTISKANSSVKTAPTAKTLTFNNADQELINAGAANNGTMQYKLNSNGTYGTSIPKAKNAGSYTIFYKVVGNNNYNDVAEKSITVTIKKANGSVTAPTAKTLTYTGSAQALVNAGSTSTGTIQYKLGTGSYNAAIPTATNAGTYIVYYKVVGNGNYNDVAEKSINVTINKAAANITAPKAKTLTFNNANQNLLDAGSCTTGTIKYSTDNSNWSTTIPQGKDAKTYTIYYKVDSTNNNYNGVGSTKLSPVINKATPAVTAPTIKTLTYTGSAQQLINAGSTNAGTLQYKLNSNGTYGTAIPTATNAGSYTVYYKVVGNSNYKDVAEKSISVTIAKKAADGTRPSAKTLTFNNANQALINAGSCTTGKIQYSTDNKTWSTTVPQGKDAKTYTVYYKIDSTNNNYNDIGSTKLSPVINKAAPTVTAPTAKTLTYTGSAQQLVNAGSTTGGTIQYKLNSNGTYGTAIPTATNAGSYTVYYKVVGNSNYKDVAEKSVSVTIAKKAADGTRPSAKTLTFNNANQALINAGSCTTGKIQYSTDNKTWSTTIPQGKDAKTYTVYYKIDSTNNNYNGVGSTKLSPVINKAAANITKPTANTLTYNGKAQALINAGSSTTGTVQYKLNSNGTWSNNVPTATNFGDYTVYYKVNSTNNNYNNLAEQSIKVTIQRPMLSQGYPGLYDKDSHRQIKSWDEMKSMGLNVEKDYTEANYKTDTGSGNYFFNHNNLTGELILPNTLKKIGDYAFCDCWQIYNTLKIPEGVTSIGITSFGYTTHIYNLYIPSTLTTLKGDSYNKNPFCGMARCNTITVASSNKVFDSRNNCNAIVRKSDNTIVVGCPKTVFVSSITGIGPCAFQSTYWWNTEVTIPGTIKHIDDYALYGNADLTKLTIQEGCTTIGVMAFTKGSTGKNLTVYAPKSLTSVANGGFYKVAQVYYSGSLNTTYWLATKIN